MLDISAPIRANRYGSQRLHAKRRLIYEAGEGLRLHLLPRQWPAVYACFFLFSDLGGRQIAFLRTLGQNALAAYILHELVARAVQAFAPADSPLWWVAATFTLYVGITYLFVRHLEKNGVYLRM